MKKSMGLIVATLFFLGFGMVGASVPGREIRAEDKTQESQRVKAEKLIEETEQILSSLGEDELNWEEATVIPAIGDLLRVPEVYQSSLVFIFGENRGWEGRWQGKDISHPQITRSDWVIRDETGAIYVTGLPAPMEKGKPVNLWGVVKINKKGVVYLEAKRVEKYISLTLFGHLIREKAQNFWNSLALSEEEIIPYFQRAAVFGRLLVTDNLYGIYDFGYYSRYGGVDLPFSALLSGNLERIGSEDDGKIVGVVGTFSLVPLFTVIKQDKRVIRIESEILQINVGVENIEILGGEEK